MNLLIIKWTNEVFKDEERIEFNISFNITEKLSTDRYKGTFNCNIQDLFSIVHIIPILNYLDSEVEFDYIETQPLDYNENTHTSNLSALLSFYTYIIIGLDYSTFSTMEEVFIFKKQKQLLKMLSLLRKWMERHLKAIKIDIGLQKNC